MSKKLFDAIDNTIKNGGSITIQLTTDYFKFEGETKQVVEHEVGKTYLKAGSTVTMPSEYYVEAKSEWQGLAGLIVRRPWWPIGQTFWVPVENVSLIELEDQAWWKECSEIRPRCTESCVYPDPE